MREGGGSSEGGGRRRERGRMGIFSRLRMGERRDALGLHERLWSRLSLQLLRWLSRHPYLQEGCQDIDECANQNQCTKPGRCHNLPGDYRCVCPFGWRIKHTNKRECLLNLPLVTGTCAGIIVLSFLGLGTYAIHEKRKASKVEEKYFNEHGGWILLEKIQSDQGFGFTIFTKQQVELATNNFDSANIVGRGGQGTVYKGNLRDQIVAIKKCKIVDESKKKEFGKEMIILSQINHKNIVKLIGCCLEVEVPMLIYEFIPNGTLHHHIHGKNQEAHISLSTRLKIAHESAEALAYLHFSASPPIFHGDVKSANILLDQNYIAKVSDFGASILAPTDEAQFVTFVQGTCGYLDLEYMQTCQLTDKSDVYSFGMVLLEILTSKPVIAFGAPEEERCLSSRFFSAMKLKKLHELLDDQIRRNEDMELVQEVALLAKACLNMKGEERPTMKEVADELDRIRRIKQHPWIQECNHDETENLLGGVMNMKMTWYLCPVKPNYLPKFCPFHVHFISFCPFCKKERDIVVLLFLLHFRFEGAPASQGAS
ncbi:Wall-associated kinase family protein [Rhynchospora pubera]|uniref:Wall-associated kinase family protein n=1 Tax=Rhynchospora pubera TaxID=906938 RepID=A0AAV8FFK2_9POAL|nr:Wall-associated kinase family protein [Rhynchospora pubera]